MEQASRRDKRGSKAARIRQVAVMRQREAAKGKLRGKRLDFHERVYIAACRIAVVADGGMAAKLLHLRGVGTEILAHMAKGPMRVKSLPVIADDACGFLSAML